MEIKIYKNDVTIRAETINDKNLLILIKDSSLKDKYIIHSFYESHDNKDEYIKSIMICDVNKIMPL